MNILDKFMVVQGNDQRPEPWERPAVVALDATQLEEHPGFATQQRYVLRAQLGVEFWANRAQYGDALHSARKTMLHRIYGGVLPMLQELRQAVFDRDAGTALSIIGRMEEEMTKCAR